MSPARPPEGAREGTQVSGEVLLSLQDVQVAYGGIQAVKAVSLEVRTGELVSLIGANGAGKSSTLKAVTGLQALAAGQVHFDGQAVRGWGTWDLARRGLVMVPEGRGIFARMSILENLHMGAYVRRDAQVQSDIDRVLALFPRLAERAHQLAGTLSGGEQQMLAMGRALMARPRLLLLDEPSMGLSPLMVDKIFEVVSGIHRQGVSILLVEQNASRALALADRAYVMESGQISLSGSGRSLLADERVRAAYLGE